MRAGVGCDTERSEGRKEGRGKALKKFGFSNSRKALEIRENKTQPSRKKC
jgi:hypothetical protein